jgi:hypothetical protein
MGRQRIEKRRWPCVLKVLALNRDRRLTLLPDALVIFINMNSERCNLRGNLYASAELASELRRPRNK